MKKKVFRMLLCLLMIAAFTVPCFAADLNNPDLPRVVDNADVFTDYEESVLNEEIYKLIEKYNMDILIMTDDSKHGYTTDTGAIEWVWDEYGFGAGPENSGWAIYLCLDPSDRYWAQSSCGKAVAYHNYDTQNIIDDYMEPNLQSGRYCDAMIVGLYQLDELFRLGPEAYVENQYNPDPGPTPNPQEPTWLEKLEKTSIGGVFAGAIAGFISMFKAKSSMKTVSTATSAGNYVQSGSFRLHREEDILLGMHVTRMEKAQQAPRGPGSGPVHSGGSSFSGPHVSSGGNTHAGGGRHF